MARRVIDLSTPIRTGHFRWPVERGHSKSHAAGDGLEATWARWSMHAFTHMDTPRHFDADGFTTDEVTPEMTMGEAAVVDISDIDDNAAVDAGRLERAGGHVRDGDIVLLRAGWDLRQSLDAPEFWTRAPYMTPEACDWLRQHRIKAIAYDFPQDYCIRHLVLGDRQPAWEENTTHVNLLVHGILMYEYLCNMMAIRGPRPFFIGLPIKLPDSDGAPVRAVAVEEDAT